MLGGLLIILLTGLASFSIIDNLKGKYPFIDARLLKRLFLYHVLLFFAYYGYVLTSPSDSQYYYYKVQANYRGETWASFYGTSTIFIEFVGYPFIKYLSFSYEAIMALFAWFGFLGFIYFYIFFKENIKFKHTLFGYDLITLFFFLPNLHFWSASFGKGALIFMGLGLYFFGIANVRIRWVAILIAGTLIYHVRPHIMLVVLLSSAIGFIFSSKGVSFTLRVVFILGASLTLLYIYQDVLSMVGINDEEVLTEGLDLTHRATELSKATSGVDITNYNLAMQLFTFIYRPLFIDAPGALGLFVSFENAFYLLITLRLFSKSGGASFLLRANFLAKSAFFSFLTVSIALAQVSGNLGIAMRQKSQVMMLLLFFIISFLDEQKINEWKARQAHKKKLDRLKKIADNANN